MESVFNLPSDQNLAIEKVLRSDTETDEMFQVNRFIIMSLVMKKDLFKKIFPVDK